MLAKSHISMRDDFGITVSEIDVLVEIVKNVMGDRGGVRMTGGGFGGCVVALVTPDLVESVKKVLEHEYETKTGAKSNCLYLSGDNRRQPT